MGGGGKGGSTTVNKVEIPPEVLARYNAVNARAETVAQQPYQEYSKDPNAFVAPLTQTQQAGIQNTNAMAGAAQPYYGAATGLAAASTGNVNPQDLNVNQYMNPFTQNVVNATQAALQQQQGQQLSQQQSDAIRGGAFGGERAGLQRAQLMGQQGLATAQAISPLYQQNYNQALAAAQQQQGVNLGAQQANRQNLQNAATLFGSIGTNAQQAGLAGAQAQLQAGQGEQQTQQAGLQALYNQFQQKQGYPFQVAQFLANIAEGTGALSGNTTTQTTTGGGGFFSDKRLKENVQKVGKTNDGQPIYRFNYKGDPRTQIGLMAQDVEKSHPEAVGLAGGYKTVDYKKATDDAVHSRRHFSGEEGSFVAPPTDAYSMTGSPSAMLSGLSLPKMTDGANIHIQPGAINPAAAGLLAPEATGYSRGTREGKQAEADSLRSSLASGYGSGIGSGPDYMNKRLAQLDDFLAQNSSQGGLVGAGGGSFARGGLAFGGVPDYTNPALAYYGPQQGQGGGLYGVQLQPGGQHQMMQGAQIQKPQQRDAMAELAATAKFAEGATGAWDKRPDFLRSEEDVAMRDRIKEAADVKNRQTIEDYYKNHPDEADKSDDGNARGGLIGHRHHYSGNAGSYVNPKASPFAGSNDWMGIDEQQPQYHLMKGGEMQRQPQQQSGLGAASQATGVLKNGKSAFDWAKKQLSGEASPTAMSSTTTEAAPGAATGAVESATAPTGGVIDLTTGAPGLAGGATNAATSAIAGAPTDTVATGLLTGAETAAPEALTALAPELIPEVAAPVVTASIADVLPFFLLKNGGAVPHRKNYQTRGLVVPDEYSTAEPDAAPAPEAPSVPEVPVEPTVRGARAVAPTPGLGAAPAPKVKVGDNELTIVPPASIPDNAGNRLPTKIPKIVQTREPAQKPFIPSLEGLGAAAKDTLSSENFWVPALTGIGSMLASPNKTLLGAVGSGLVGGAGAYGEMKKLDNQQAQQRLAALKGRFVGPTLVNGKMVYRDTWTGENVDQSEYGARVQQHLSGKTPGAASPAAVGTARDVITEGAPKIERPAASTNQTTVATPDQGGTAAGTAKPPGSAALPKPGEAPSANAVATGAVPETGANLIAMDQAMLDNEDLWKGLPPPMRPKALLNDATAMDGKIRQLETNRDTIENSVGETPQSKAISAEIASLRTERQNKIVLAQQQMARATKLQEEAASADIRRRSGVQEEADKIELLPRKQALELQGEIAKKGALNPIDLQQKQAEADIQRTREVQTAREKLPTEEAKAAFDANVRRQDAALQKAAAEAKEAQVARSQAQAALSVMFDKNGKPTISSGPLGPRIANVAAYMSQLGFSDKFINDLTKTNPSNAQMLDKLQTAMTAEIARLELAGSPVRVSEFQQFMRSVPNATLLPNAFKWIVENTIIPKAQASIDAYRSVKELTPGVEDGKNIEGRLFDYYDANPWFSAKSGNSGEGSAAISRQAPPPTPENLRSAAEERQRRDSLRRNP
ncbi:Intramolecular chaperone auto-processing domain containing protein [uncultured Caudovirales phage]|uniref:Intramolecular chaperone auto-processing domain containing protein n=1 Tax=uncultured Caudovirales phage TaxID=2100421 RepID=A0A6J5LD05_9CAUD|nr:Intramolecular chaperone auto-processing domain containing protein [uncultured Caudovirales phage]